LFRIGFGYDVHRLVKGRPLILGGVEIPHSLGLEGHSDADVLAHAVIDAMIGALGRGDIGQHFPDTDPSYKDVSSLLLLERVVSWMKRDGFRLNNLDATIVAERPRLALYVTGMQTKMAGVLQAPRQMVNIKAKTTESLGFCGRQEGVEAFAVVSLVGTDRGEM
jgi:2-C-methyl-D-erythritol 2,4-cyclodiphosphate synthase